MMIVSTAGGRYLFSVCDLNTAHKSETRAAAVCRPLRGVSVPLAFSGVEFFLGLFRYQIRPSFFFLFFSRSAVLSKHFKNVNGKIKYNPLESDTACYHHGRCCACGMWDACVPAGAGKRA